MVQNTDPHTYHQTGQPVPVHVDIAMAVDFETRVLRVSRQRVTFDKPGLVYLDSKGQDIEGVFDGDGEKLDYRLDINGPVLGAQIELVVPESLEIELVFKTNPSAIGLQWTTPQQAGGEYPVLYSQGECINGRSILILPDAPSVRFTWHAMLEVPRHMRGLMSAGAHKGRIELGNLAVEEWEMSTPVPLYLFAINVGDFKEHKFDDRSGVWASPQLLGQASKALSRTPEILAAAEALFGPYLWETYSTIVLPQRGFPIGAMEHPCLTSMNAMLIWGAHAAVRVTIHELMHSWFGNLITNRTWNDFWLNEGVTTFAEWWIIREVLGEDAMYLQIAQVMEEMHAAIKRFTDMGKPELTRLKTDLGGVNPDDSFSRIPYCKGALFLWAIMEVVGRERMLEFLRTYIATYRFKSIDSEEFLRFAAAELGQGVLDTVDANAWVYEPGLPSTMPKIVSPIAVEIEEHAARMRLPVTAAKKWDDQRWELYLAKLTRKVTPDFLRAINERFGFSTHQNGMLQFAFLRAAVESKAVPVETYLSEVKVFLCNYGRTVYLKPLYEGLCERGRLDLARSIFEKARAGYHPIGQEQVEKELERYALAA